MGYYIIFCMIVIISCENSVRGEENLLGILNVFVYECEVYL
jgi:hypothetical protein